MINYLILHYLNGEEKTIKWGSHQDEKKLTETITIDQRIFHCHRKEQNFSRLIGHYYEDIKYANSKKIKKSPEKSLQQKS